MSMSDIHHLSKQQGTPPVATGQPDVEPPIPMKKKSYLEVWVANCTKYVCKHADNALKNQCISPPYRGLSWRCLSFLT